jgi:hypothetical protein
MQGASETMRGLRLPLDTASGEELARAAWPHAVGKCIANHTRASRLVRTRLVVEVEDRVWHKQLSSVTPHIIGNLAKLLGHGVVEDVELRVMPRRREPQRATEALADVTCRKGPGRVDRIIAASAWQSVREASKKLA